MSPSQISSGAIVLATLTAALALKYPDRAVFDEHRENVVYPKGLPIVGNLLNISKNKDRYFEYVVEIYEKLDTLTLSSSLTLPSNISTVDPRNVEYILKHNFENYSKGEYFHKVFDDFLGKGIFNSDGENWRLQRKAAAQIFHVRNFQTEFTRVFVEHINILNTHILEKTTDDCSVIDLHNVMLRFTMDIFVNIAFGVKVDSLLKKIDFADSFDAIQFYNFRCFIFPLNSVTERVKEGLNFWDNRKKTIAQHLDVVNNFAYKIIKERHEALKNEDENSNSFNENTDLLYRFMKTKTPEGNLYTDKELRDSMLNFIVAGRDTSAQTLSWFFYNIMLYPRIENKLLQEVNQYITDGIENDTTALYEATKKMTYFHAVLSEVLRLFPGVPGNRRQALNDDIWPDGTQILKGEYVNYQTFCQGRLTKIWGPDAKEFKPERWIASNGSLIRAEQGKWSAFNAGPRLCLGMNMATLEIIITTAMVLKKYKFRPVPGHKIEFLNQVTLSMKDGMKVFVERR
ncbi:hypothetical protein MFLAVUS_000523 [Mucor flavus]|uniref:Cytochrome P450 n=1 Tax=Mucor flavus TaxID=439312 RepID=A0ABP9YJZ4_9FUNG